MTTFADIWNAEAVAPVTSGVFDPQGMNFTSEFTTPLGQPQTSQGTFLDAANNAATLPNSGPNFFSNALTNITNGTIAGTGATIAGALTGSQSATPGTSPSLSSTVSSYFGRAVIIILGFIFVAAGLYMFKSGVTVRGALEHTG